MKNYKKISISDADVPSRSQNTLNRGFNLKGLFLNTTSILLLTICFTTASCGINSELNGNFPKNRGIRQRRQISSVQWRVRSQPKHNFEKTDISLDSSSKTRNRCVTKVPGNTNNNTNSKPKVLSNRTISAIFAVTVCSFFVSIAFNIRQYYIIQQYKRLSNKNNPTNTNTKKETEEKNNEIIALKRAIEEKNNEIANHESTIANHEYTIADHEYTIADHESKIANHESTIANLENESKNLMKTIKEKNNEIEEQNKTIVKQENEIEEQENEIEEQKKQIFFLKNKTDNVVKKELIHIVMEMNKTKGNAPKKDTTNYWKKAFNKHYTEIHKLIR